jgi:F420-dependent oxidoreductase-like protein
MHDERTIIMAKLNVGFHRNKPTTEATVAAIAESDQAGVSTAWLTAGGTGLDPLGVLVAAAARTARINLGTSIVPAYGRHPIVLATQALVLADLAPGRLRLGVGPSHRPAIEGVFGIPHVKPLAYMREYLAVLRELLWNGNSEFTGEFFTVHASLAADRTPPQTPLLLSALREKAFQLAGEISDGAISWMCPVPYLVKTALPALQAGAASVNRAVPPLIAHVPVALHDEATAVHDAARTFLGRYAQLPFYQSMFADAGYPVTADQQLSDPLIDSLVVWGSEERIAQRLAEIQGEGMSELLIAHVPVSGQPDEEARLTTLLGRL